MAGSPDPELLKLILQAGIGPIDPERVRRTYSLMEPGGIEDRFRRRVESDLARGINPWTPSIGSERGTPAQSFMTPGPLDLNRMERERLEAQMPYGPETSNMAARAQEWRDAAQASDENLGYLFKGVEPTERSLTPMDFTDAGDPLAFMDFQQHMRRGQYRQAIPDLTIAGIGALMPFGSLRGLMSSDRAGKTALKGAAGVIGDLSPHDDIGAVTDVPVAWLKGFEDPNATTEMLRSGAVKEGTDPRHYERLTKDIAENGVRQPITVQLRPDGTGYVWDGMHRLAIAEDLGIENLPVIFTSSYQGTQHIMDPGEVLRWIDTAEEAQRPGRRAVIDLLSSDEEAVQSLGAFNAEEAERYAASARRMSQGRGLVTGHRIGGTWHSRALQAIDESPQETATGSQWLSQLRKNPDPVTRQARGGSERELDATRLLRLLEDNPDVMFSKDDLRAVWMRNGSEVTFGEEVLQAQSVYSEYQEQVLRAEHALGKYQSDIEKARLVTPKETPERAASRLADLDANARKIRRDLTEIANVYRRAGFEDHAAEIEALMPDVERDMVAFPDVYPDVRNNESFEGLVGNPMSNMSSDQYNNYTLRMLGRSGDRSTPEQQRLWDEQFGRDVPQPEPVDQMSHVLTSMSRTDPGGKNHFGVPQNMLHVRTTRDVLEPMDPTKSAYDPTIHVDELQSDAYQPDLKLSLKPFDKELRASARKAFEASRTPGDVWEQAGFAGDDAWNAFRATQSYEDLYRLGLKNLDDARRAEIEAATITRAPKEALQAADEAVAKADPVSREITAKIEDLAQNLDLRHTTGRLRRQGMDRETYDAMREGAGPDADWDALSDPENAELLTMVDALARIDPRLRRVAEGERFRVRLNWGDEQPSLFEGTVDLRDDPWFVDQMLNELHPFFDSRDVHVLRPEAKARWLRGNMVAALRAAPGSKEFERLGGEFPRWLFDEVYGNRELLAAADAGELYGQFGEVDHRLFRRFFDPESGYFDSADEAWEGFKHLRDQWMSEARATNNTEPLIRWGSSHATAGHEYQMVTALFEHLFAKNPETAERFAREVWGPGADVLVRRNQQAAEEVLVRSEAARARDELRRRRDRMPHEPTDEWVKAGLRRAVQAAAGANIPRISITAGDYLGMGGVESTRPSGMRYFYDPKGKIVRKNLEAVAKELGLPKSAVRTGRRIGLPEPGFPHIVTVSGSKRDTPEWEVLYDRRMDVLGRPWVDDVEDLRHQVVYELGGGRPGETAEELLGHGLETPKDQMLARARLYEIQMRQRARDLDAGRATSGRHMMKRAHLPLDREGGSLDEEIQDIYKWIEDNYDENGFWKPQEEMVLELGDEVMQKLRAGEMSTRILGAVPFVGFFAAQAARNRWKEREGT